MNRINITSHKTQQISVKILYKPGGWQWIAQAVRGQKSPRWGPVAKPSKKSEGQFRHKLKHISASIKSGSCMLRNLERYFHEFIKNHNPVH